MRKPGTRIWGSISSDPLVNDATPAPALALLRAAVTIVEDAAVTPYTGCGRLFDGCGTGTSGGRTLGLRIAPGAQHARAAVQYAMDPSTATVPGQTRVSLTSATGGTTGANIIDVYTKAQFNVIKCAPGITWNNHFYWWMQESSDHVDDNPAARMDRQIELTAQRSPYTEQVYVSNAAGVTFWVSERVADLETLT